MHDTTYAPSPFTSSPSPPPPPTPPPTVTSKYTATVAKLSRMSVQKHFDAYRDVPWESEPIERDDPRWALTPDDPLGATDWYRELRPTQRTELGLTVLASQLRIGVEFERVLARGLLELATTLPPTAPEVRYAYHEIIEESQHSLMFLEVLRRTGLDAPGLGGLEAWFAARVPALGRTFPEMFFLHVLGGETPVDHLQRRALQRGDALHPIMRRVMQIHVTEEARHVCFAETFLDDRMPRLGRLQRLRLQLVAPFILFRTARAMLRPPAKLLHAWNVPKAVVREAFETGTHHRQLMLDGVAPIRELCARLGILTPTFTPLWRTLGIAG